MSGNALEDAWDRLPVWRLSLFVAGHELVSDPRREEPGKALTDGHVQPGVSRRVSLGQSASLSDFALPGVRGYNLYYPIQLGAGRSERPIRGMRIPLLAGFLTQLDRLVCEFPQISEVDLNPVKGEEVSLFAVDCRIIIHEN